MLPTMGFISCIPIFLAIFLSFITRNTLLSLSVSCIIGVVIEGKGVWGFTDLLKLSLGTPDFIWVVTINFMVAVMAAYFGRSGAILEFTSYISKKNLKRQFVQLITWSLGCLIFFSDSFSPIFVGSVMRKVSDKAKISREKLAYLCDTTSTPVAVVLPVTSWSAYLSGLTIGIGSITTADEALDLFVKAMPLNFYAIISIIFSFCISMRIIRDFGPMRKAERRALFDGKLLRDGAVPLLSRELTDLKPYSHIKGNLFLNFILPILLFLGISLITFGMTGAARVMEASVIVVIFLSVSLFIQGMPLQEVSDTFMMGIKGAMPAVILLSLAYSLNKLSSDMGTANFIINCFGEILNPELLPLIIFISAAVMSFSTGSSWGTFAICMPIALPLAFYASNNEINYYVALCFAAVASGGVFGDHCSPVSDTTILSSMGAACDHIDHVKTQLPYALLCAFISAFVFMIVGFFLK